mmetsp:Transcript_56633/g.168545  ORF Transcript_56633/g.168545 Transcript_56633/m.168545 type:complete len:425 (+) Transcript_56633:65-1339(+)
MRPPCRAAQLTYMKRSPERLALGGQKLSGLQQTSPVARPRARLLVFKFLLVGDARECAFCRALWCRQETRHPHSDATPPAHGQLLLPPHDHSMPLVHRQMIALVVLSECLFILLDCCDVLFGSHEGLPLDQVPRGTLARHGERRPAHGRLRLGVTDDRERLPGTVVQELLLPRGRSALQERRVLGQLLLKTDDVILRGHQEARGPDDDVRRRPPVRARGHRKPVRMREEARLPARQVQRQGQLDHRILRAERKVTPLARHGEAVVEQVVCVRAHAIADGHGRLRGQHLAGLQNHGGKAGVIGDVGVGAILLVLQQVLVRQQWPLRQGQVVIHEVDEWHDGQLRHGPRLVLPVREVDSLTTGHHDHGPFLEVDDRDGLLDAGNEVGQLVVLRFYGCVNVHYVHCQEVRAVKPVQVLVIPEDRHVG